MYLDTLVLKQKHTYFELVNQIQCWINDDVSLILSCRSNHL